MNRILIFLVLAFAALPVFAQVAAPTATEQLYTEVAQMTPAQRAKLLENAEAIRSGRSAAAATSEWIEVGERLGQGLAATARELGVAVNDFAKTPVGMVAIGLLVWNIMGSDIVHVGTAFGILFFGFPIWWMVARSMFGVYDDKGKYIRFKYDSNQNEAPRFFFWITPIVMFMATIIMLVTT